MQACGHRLRAVIGFEFYLLGVQRFELIQPLGDALRRLRGLRGRQAKTFQIDQAPNALWARACVQHGHVAAHAVADQVHGLIARGVVVEQGV